MPGGAAAVERVFREEYGRLIASLVRRFGDIDIAEEAAGEALLAAVEKWPVDGVPPNPGGWLTTTATRKALDRMWTLQKPDGSWDWIKCDWPPLEHDDYYGATLAALAAGVRDAVVATADVAKDLVRVYVSEIPPERMLEATVPAPS
jgi:DNA-directed RNA polymerase specialized sigma24 family protein